MNLATTLEEIPDYYINTDVFQKTYNNNDFKKSTLESLFTNDKTPRKDIPIVDYDDFIILLYKLDYYGINPYPKIVIDFINDHKFDKQFWDEFVTTFFENSFTEEALKIRDDIFSRYKKISCGTYNATVINKRNVLTSWGFYVTPRIRSIFYLENVISVESGDSHITALKDDGKITSSFEYGKKFKTDDIFELIAARWDNSLALRTDGTLFYWGFENQDFYLRSFKNIGKCLQIVCGDGFFVAIKEDGTLFSHGLQSRHRMDRIPNEIIIDEEVYERSTDFFLSDYPTDRDRKTVRIDNLKFIKVACAQLYTAGILDNGSLVTWGYLGVYFTRVLKRYENDKFKDIACGDDFTIAIREDNSLAYINGTDNFLSSGIKINENEKFTKISAGAAHFLALRIDGSLFCSSKEQSEGMPNEGVFISIECGRFNSLAIRDDGKIFYWGSNNFNQLNGTPESIN